MTAALTEAGSIFHVQRNTIFWLVVHMDDSHRCGQARAKCRVWTSSARRGHARKGRFHVDDDLSLLLKCGRKWMQDATDIKAYHTCLLRSLHAVHMKNCKPAATPSSTGKPKREPLCDERTNAEITDSWGIARTPVGYFARRAVQSV